MFADKYLLKNSVQPLLKPLPDGDLSIIVVIPCLREPNIIGTLQSLINCKLDNLHIEVIVVVNHSEIADRATRIQNNQTKLEIDVWAKQNKKPGIDFYALGPVEFKKKWAGVGLARKKGMDEALLRFDSINKANGIIVSLDADTLVEPDYFVEISRYFGNNPTHVAGTISFRHDKTNLPEKQKEGIELYEKYLAYYKNALAYTGFPYALFTIGSAFAVTAIAYMKRGGMNRRQAGEDFYFLQNLVQIGTIGEIKSTMVYPSARLSDRVPFGTGPILQKWMDGQEDLTQTYNLKAFEDLKLLFDNIGALFKIDENRYLLFAETLPKPVNDFLLTDNFWSELSELNNNCSSIKIFKTRFFQKFNAFKILKFLNFSHDRYYAKKNLDEQIQKLPGNI